MKRARSYYEARDPDTVYEETSHVFISNFVVVSPFSRLEDEEMEDAEYNYEKKK